MKSAIKIFAGIAFIALVAFTSHKPYTGNWSGLASNQFISYEDVQNGVSTGALSAYGSDPSLSATKWITKDQFTGWIRTTSASGSSNQWITKSMISTVYLPNSMTVYSNATCSGGFLGYSTVNAACAAGTGGDVTVYYNSGPIYWQNGVTTSLFSLSSCDVSRKFFLTSNGNVIEIDGSGNILSTNNCTTEAYVTILANTTDGCNAIVTAQVWQDPGHSIPLTVDENIGVSYTFYDDYSNPYIGSIPVYAGNASGLTSYISISCGSTGNLSSSIVTVSPNPTTLYHFNY